MDTYTLSPQIHPYSKLRLILAYVISNASRGLRTRKHRFYAIIQLHAAVGQLCRRLRGTL